MIGADTGAAIHFQAIAGVAQHVQRHTHRQVRFQCRIHRDQGAFGGFFQAALPIEDAVQNGLAVLRFANLEIRRVGRGFDEIAGGVNAEQAWRLALDLAAEQEGGIEVDVEAGQRGGIAVMHLAQAIADMARRLEQIWCGKQAGAFLALMLEQQADHCLRDRQIAGREQHNDAFAGLLEYGHLAEGIDLVDASVCSGIG